MYRKKNSPFLKHLDFEIVDFAILEFVMHLISRFRTNAPSFYNIQGLVYTAIAFFFCLTTIIRNPYRSVIRRGFYKEFTAIVGHFVWIDALLILYLYINHIPEELPRFTIVLHLIISVLLAYIVHWLMKKIVRARLKKYSKASPLIIISDGNRIMDTISRLMTEQYPTSDLKAIVLVDHYDQESEERLKKYLQEQSSEQIPVLYGIDEGYKMLQRDVVDKVFVDQEYDGFDWKQVIANILMMGTIVHVGLGALDAEFPNSSMTKIGDRLCLTTTMSSAFSWELTVKRMMDIAGAIVGLIITFIVGLFIVPIIKILDPGPAIFTQIRVGMNGRHFKFYKFRSMYMDAEERKKELMEYNQMDGLMFKMDNDPRIIGGEKGFGGFIRRTSLDELPQFWNVLKGDMSLVGTRPPTLGEYEKYEMRHKARLSIKPGLTGLWQISGRSDIKDFEEIVKLDTDYITNWNLGLDIKILLKTVWVVIRGVGSK